jgi:hypothetical protein
MPVSDGFGFASIRGLVPIPQPQTAFGVCGTGLRALHAHKARSDNPCRLRFWTFLRKCVWSIDEAKAGEVRRWPTGLGRDGRSWDRLWLEQEDAILRHKLLMFEKSRRVLASWFVCAFDIWLLAGGEDARWVNEEGVPVLCRSSQNRAIYLQARKLEGPAGAEWFLANRVARLLQGFEDNGGREVWPDFPQWSAKTGIIELSNGSKIQAVPQGPHQIRGAAATLLHMEEVAFWEQAKPTIGAAIPTMRGGGHIVLVTTPQVGSYAKDIRDGTLKKGGGK